MKTQLNSIIFGNSSTVGTSLEEKQNTALQIFQENGTSMTIEIAFPEHEPFTVDLALKTSASGATKTYVGEISAETFRSFHKADSANDEGLYTISISDTCEVLAHGEWKTIRGKVRSHRWSGRLDNSFITIK